MPKLDRRAFLMSAAAAGGALTLGFAIPLGRARADDAAPEITAWIVIAPDDRVTIRIARSEMGQGITTALPMLVAEELGCDWSKVQTEFVAPEENLRRSRAWGDMSTGGSRSVRTSQDFLRKAGATARAMLIAAAAARWNAPAHECAAANGVISHAPSRRTLRFGEVAAAAAAVAPPKNVRLKAPNEWTLIGTPRRRLDVADKVAGKPIYAIDVRLPGMLYAALAQCPVFKGRLERVDETRIAGMSGVRRVIRFDDAVAVVADGWWQARKALDALNVVWDAGQNGAVTSASIATLLRAGLDFGRGGRRTRARRRHDEPGAEPEPPHRRVSPALSGARDARAAELHRARGRRPGRDLGADAARRIRHRGGGRRGRRAGAERQGPQDAAGRRVRPARHRAGLHPACGEDRQERSAGRCRRSGRAKRTCSTTTTGPP